ncbi:hypothetical protein [Gordonia sp. KTR9]|uniref:hypothetical protein n=1 Tax=Gordonia sp. KTR9 TaxID=337191 RepID=UPI00027DD9BB|nr:hypothetical protein [Gordonia sp. KTR9]AFR48002.1 hypothetical protein KTR9_1362 [Gordonia sp. KTR9]
MTAYQLVAIEFTEVLARNEKGQPTKIHRYRQGDTIELTGSEEQRLVKAGAVVPVVEVEPVDAGDPPADDPDGDDPDGSGDGDGSDPDPDGDDELKRPRKAGPVDDWRAYAVSKGVDADKAEGMTKAELIELVGGED